MSAAAWIGAASSLITSALDFFDGDKKREAELLLKQVENLHAESVAQAEINKVEAAHDSLFVAGWRPFIGWVSAGAYAYQYLIRPLLAWGAMLVYGPDTALIPPAIDSDIMMELTLGMLGFGSLRTIEKWQKVAR